ncbi:hypothetical protein FKP32DRAFT_445975 [Trametes sanguinea]|nr:hypothetical protein FKP32DRAFT_445975 [Trametes sanguinea]
MDKTIKHWRAEPKNSKLIAEVYAIEKYDLKTATETAKRLGATIAIISEEGEPSVQTPQEKPDDVPVMHAPTAILISDLTKRTKDLLLDMGTWSTDGITFTVHEFERVVPEFLLALEGFTQDRPLTVAKIIQETLEANPARTNIEKLVLKNPKLMVKGADSLEITMSYISKLHVKMRRLIEGDETSLLIAYVYMKSPAYTSKEWESWRETLFDHDFTGRNGRKVKIRRTTRCAGCHGVDHMSHQCPFPLIEGWNGGPASKPQTPATAGRTNAGSSGMGRAYDVGHGAPQGSSSRGGGPGRGSFQQGRGTHGPRGYAGKRPM